MTTFDYFKFEMIPEKFLDAYTDRTFHIEGVINGKRFNHTVAWLDSESPPHKSELRYILERAVKSLEEELEKEYGSEQE